MIAVYSKAYGKTVYAMNTADARAIAQNDKWITVHPNGKDAKGRPTLIGDDGTVKGGMGGKFNGTRIGQKKVSPKKDAVKYDVSFGAKTKRQAQLKMPDSKFIKKYGDEYYGFDSQEQHDKWAKDSWAARLGKYRTKY